jgi:DNA polymerase III sliding clamp (beta) subunit (PCNA family)
MSTTTTANQVSSPYAIYENETKIASIPYEVLRVASQFVSKDYAKQLLMGIHLKVEKDEIIVASTDGHRLFYFKFPNNQLGFKLNKNITIPGAVFKSQIKQATKVLITDNLITFMNEEIFLSSVHYQQFEGTYPNIEQLIPDSFTNNFEGREFSFNCDYIGQFCNQVKKLSTNKAITFNGNKSTSPFVITAKWDIKNPFETLEGFSPVLKYLIMPIMKRD